jgi:transcriptional regulator with XRE-family HTH domain
MAKIAGSTLLSSRLRKVREKHDVSLRELGQATGIDFSLIAKYENDQREISEETYWQLRDGIGKILAHREREKLDREALAELFEKSETKPLDPEARRALVNRFFTEPEFRTFYVEEYEKFYASHPDTPHLTPQQVDEIRRRANKRMQQLAALDEFQSKVHDPALSEIIASFRRDADRLEELEQENVVLRAALKNKRH